METLALILGFVFIGALTVSFAFGITMHAHYSKAKTMPLDAKEEFNALVARGDAAYKFAMLTVYTSVAAGTLALILAIITRVAG